MRKTSFRWTQGVRGGVFGMGGTMRVREGSRRGRGWSGERPTSLILAVYEFNLLLLLSLAPVPSEASRHWVH